MAKEIKAKALATEEELSVQEKEEVVQKNAGFDEESGMYKVDYNKINNQEQEDAVQEQETEDSVPSGSSEVEENGEEAEVGLQEIRDEEEEVTEEPAEEAVLEEITDEEDTVDDTGVEGSPEVTNTPPQQEEVLPEVKAQEAIEYPENIQDLVKFMNETGGTLEDYVALNKDYEKFEQMDLLHEYYSRTKPHLSADEIAFLIDDSFSYDEEIDEPTDIKRKKLAFKEAVAEAKYQLEAAKVNYYKEIKAGSRLTPEAQEAIDFFNRYNEETEANQKIAQSQRDVFNNKTNSLFNDNFKGFEYNVGDKRYRFNVKNVNQVRETQSDINNFAKKFLNKNNEMDDATGYHKALFTGMNADAIAQHFYEQGKADAIKQSVTSAKNINMSPRSGHQDVEVGGMKARVISGDDLSGIKLKLKNY
jgi:hypothetical protein|tara:strand:- start:1168 stop:2421 length:1254 start_codon:yes stop_codon:yes gene_type:complete